MSDGSTVLETMVSLETTSTASDETPPSVEPAALVSNLSASNLTMTLDLNVIKERENQYVCNVMFSETGQG